jgi:hypothetical protein
MNLSRRGTWAALLGLAISSLIIVAVPVFLIRPFSPQTPGSMALAFGLRRWSPLFTLVALIGAIILAVRLWNPGRRLLARSGLVLLVALSGVMAWGARQNHFEWMFVPLPGPGFVRAADAGFVDPGDMVMAVALKGDPVAYPVRQLAYHHVVQDSVGGIPIVATY